MDKPYDIDTTRKDQWRILDTTRKDQWRSSPPSEWYGKHYRSSSIERPSTGDNSEFGIGREMTHPIGYEDIISRNSRFSLKAIDDTWASLQNRPLLAFI